MDEQQYCTDLVIGGILRQYLLGGDADIPRDVIKDALWHLRVCKACEDQHPDAAKDFHGWYAAIIGGRVPVSPGETSEAENHWRSCLQCQKEFPSGVSQLVSIRSAVQEEAITEIIRLFHEYESNRHALLAGIGEEPEGARDDVGTRMLANLASKAPLVAWDLDYFHEMVGLTSFCVFPDRSNFEAMEAWRETARIVRAVPRDVRQFIFSATLCGELLGHHLNEEDLVADIQDVLSHSINCGVLLSAVEAAAIQCLERYLDDNPEQPGLLSDFERRQEDRLASLVERIDRKPSDYEARLKRELGPTYEQLLPATKEFLQEAELNFDKAHGSTGYGNAVNNFAQAFENEFTTRIAVPVAEELVKLFGARYQPKKDHPPFVEDRALFPKLTLGNYEGYLRDLNVQRIVTELRMNPEKLRQGIYRLRPLRDRVHPKSAVRSAGGGEVWRPISPKEAKEVREMILGSASILRLLFPSTGS
jgi:hypothetical protein